MDAQAVKEFTEGAAGTPCPSIPSPLNFAEVHFIVHMVMSELVELAQTITPDAAAAVELVKSCAGADVKVDFRAPQIQDPDYAVKMWAAQYDSFVDAYYYMLNAA